jgi:hypothetical protein
MCQEEKYYLENFLRIYQDLSISKKFHMYFDMRGEHRMRRDFGKIGNRRKHHAVSIFLRIYNHTYYNFIGGYGIFDEKLLQ